MLLNTFIMNVWITWHPHDWIIEEYRQKWGQRSKRGPWRHFSALLLEILYVHCVDDNGSLPFWSTSISSKRPWKYLLYTEITIEGQCGSIGTTHCPRGGYLAAGGTFKHPHHPTCPIKAPLIYLIWPINTLFWHSNTFGSLSGKWWDMACGLSCIWANGPIRNSNRTSFRLHAFGSRFRGPRRCLLCKTYLTRYKWAPSCEDGCCKLSTMPFGSTNLGSGSTNLVSGSTNLVFSFLLRRFFALGDSPQKREKSTLLLFSIYTRLLFRRYNCTKVWYMSGCCAFRRKK